MQSPLSSHLREIGPIARLQIQRSSLKVEQGASYVYDPIALLAIEQLQVSANGVMALRSDDEPIMDIHNRAHPHSRFSGMNSMSLGFTSQYVRMRDRFGEHMQDGVAGENILIESAQTYALDDFKYGVVIHCSADDEYLWLGDVIVAHPCIEFSRFAVQNTKAEESSKAIKATLQFLDEGTRGFYTTPVIRDTQPIISVGDRVYIGGA